MRQESVQAKAARRVKEHGLADIPSGWRGCDAVWPVLEEMASDGAVVLVKIDGERTSPGDNGRYTIVVSGGPLGEDYFHTDTQNLEEGIAKAIVHYSDRCWRKPGNQAERPST